jgi:hypothetical protein
VPRWSRQDDAAVTRFLDHAGAHRVPRLQDQRELPLQQDIIISQGHSGLSRLDRC